MNPWSTFINTIKSFYEESVCKYQRMYKSKTTYKTRWDGPFLVDRLKLNDGLFVLTDEMKEIVKDIQYFLSPKAQKTFKEKGFSYCKRLCIYGPPGTGKSNFGIRIAGEFDLPIYNITCQGIKDEDLDHLFDEVQRGIIIIEELDKCIDELVKYSKSQNSSIKSDPFAQKNPTGTYPRLISWHRVLDKIIGNQVIVYATTNNIELLEKLNHGSLIRSERMDKIVKFDYICHNIIEEMVNKFYKKKIKLSITNKNITPADIINILKDHNTNINNINDLIQQISNRKNGKKTDPSIEDLSKFISNMIIKTNETISQDFVMNLSNLLNKNGINNIKDAEILLKNEDAINKVLENDNLSLLDVIKFKSILK